MSDISEPKSFALESFKSTITLPWRFPKIFLFAVILQLIALALKLLHRRFIFYLFTTELQVQHSLLGLPIYLLMAVPSLPLGLIMPGTGVLYSWGEFYWLLTLSDVIGVLRYILIFLVATVFFPLLVSQAFENQKVSLRDAFNNGFPRIPHLFAYFVVFLGILLLLALVGVLFLIIPGVGFFLLIVYMFPAAYILFRLWLVLPTLMLETNKETGRRVGLLEAYRRGFSHTEGKVLSIWGAIILLSLTILLPLNIINLFVALGIWTRDLFFNPLFGLYAVDWIDSIWNFGVGLTGGLFSALLPPIYYNISVRRKRL